MLYCGVCLYVCFFRLGLCVRRGFLLRVFVGIQIPYQLCAITHIGQYVHQAVHFLPHNCKHTLPLINCLHTKTIWHTIRYICIVRSNNAATLKLLFMLTVTCKGLYTYIVDSVSIVNNMAAIVLNNGRGVKLVNLSDILLIEPTNKA